VSETTPHAPTEGESRSPTDAAEAVRRCDEHLVAAGKLAIESGEYRQGTAHLILAAQALARGVSALRSGGVAPAPGAPASITLEDLLDRPVEPDGLHRVAREAAYLELTADEARRGEVARREFARDPVRWSASHGKYARALAVAFRQWDAVAISGGRATATPSAGGDAATFSDLWLAVNGLSRELKATLRLGSSPGSPPTAPVTVDWLSPPPDAPPR